MSNKIQLVAPLKTSSPLKSNSSSELHHRPTAKSGKDRKSCPKEDDEIDDKTVSHRNITPAGNFAQTSTSMVDGKRLYPPGPNASTPSISTHSRTPSPNGYHGRVRQESVSDVPRVWGFPLKYVSLVTLALQNAILAIIMHYSRVSVPANKVYSAASAVLVNEILKGGISFGIAYARLNPANGNDGYERILDGSPSLPSYPSHSLRPQSKLQILFKQVASPDSWKLSIPALLYVLQNNLQYIAVSNLDVPTFQVTNQMKILTTAAFSVLLLKKRLSGWKWASLALLAVGVGIVQIQASTGVDPSHTLRSEVTERSSVQIGDSLGTGQDTVNLLPAELHPIRGFLAVTAACFTSGLAGVYFEMVLKGSSADLWVRNVQLSLWSLIPAFFPVIVGLLRDGQGIRDMFQNFGGWAWVTVITQVSGGLITALVIKYSDNILKGFATSLSIIVSFLASVAIFNHPVTASFVIGASIVLAATWMYNSPDRKPSASSITLDRSRADAIRNTSNDINGATNGDGSPLSSRRPRMGGRLDTDIDVLGNALTSPMEQHEPLLGYANRNPDPSNFSRPGHERKGSMGGLIEKVSSLVVPRKSGDEKDFDNEKNFEMEVRSAGSSSNG